MASKMDLLCKNMVEEVDGSLAFGVVDLESGMMLGVYHTVAHFSQDYLDAVAAAAVDMFRGRNISRIEQLIAKQRGSEPEHTVQETFMTTKGTFHFMKTIPGKQAVAVMVTRRSTNQGMGWSTLRLGVSDIAELLP